MNQRLTFGFSRSFAANIRYADLRGSRRFRGGIINVRNFDVPKSEPLASSEQPGSSRDLFLLVFFGCIRPSKTFAASFRTILNENRFLSARPRPLCAPLLIHQWRITAHPVAAERTGSSWKFEQQHCQPDFYLPDTKRRRLRQRCVFGRTKNLAKKPQTRSMSCAVFFNR